MAMGQNPMEQAAWNLAVAAAQFENEEGPAGEQRRLVMAWIDKERKKLKPADFPRYRNLPGEDWEDFKLQMDTAFRRCGHNAADSEGRKSAWIGSLQGNAHSIVKEIILARDNLTLEQLLERFQTAFTSPMDGEYMKQIYMNHKQKATEEPTSYVAKKLALWRQAYPEPRDERAFMFECSKSLYNKSVRISITREIGSFNGIESYKARLNDLTAAEKILMNQGDLEDTDAGGLMSTQRLETRLDGTEPMDMSALAAIAAITGKAQCFNCGVQGHWARDCTKPKKATAGPSKPNQQKTDTQRKKGNCNRCSAPGHWKKECRVPEHKLEKARADNKARAAKAAKQGVREMQENSGTAAPVANGLGADDMEAQVAEIFQGMGMNSMDEVLSLDANGFLVSGNGRGYGH